MRKFRSSGWKRCEYDRRVLLKQGRAHDWAFIIAMAQFASTLDDRPLPEADDPVVRSLLPSSPEAAVIAMDERPTPLGAAWWFFHDPPLIVDRGGCAVPEMTIAVRETQRRQGIGTALIEALLAQVAEDFDQLSLNVHLLNPAVHLYARTGFQVAGRGRGRFGVAMVRATGR
jgi:GNAT superfamily N-acetyltransferase